MIPIEQTNDLKPLTLLVEGDFSRIYRTKDGRLLKQVKNSILNMYTNSGISYEMKILDSDRIEGMYEIAKPLTAAYNENVFIGYTMYPNLGVSYNTYKKEMSKTEQCNLHFYANNHKQLIDIVKRGNDQDMVFPDIASASNIFIDDNGHLSLIDFDGMQYKEYGSESLSDRLPKLEELSSKYIKAVTLFSSELDKLSLLYFYFADALNCNLKESLKLTSLKSVFDEIGFEDEEILLNKINAILNNNQKGVFLEDEIFKIAQKYICVPYDVPGAVTFRKRLIRK